MSQNKEEQITCPKCHSTGKFKIWQNITATQNPELAGAIVNGSIFRYTCPKCGEVVNIDYSLLYEDPSKYLLVYYADNEAHAKEMTKILTTPDEKIGGAVPFVGHTRRIVRSQNQLREKILLSACGLDDRVIEIIKLLLVAQFMEKYPGVEIDEVLCYVAENNERTMIFLNEGQQIGTAPFAHSLYMNVSIDYAAYLPKKDETLVVDYSWALATINKLQ